MVLERVEEREEGRKGASGAPRCVHAEEESRETRRAGAVWKSREVWRNLAVESV